VRLLPFFTYYGGKYRMAPKYPSPRHDTVVEPFAGSAGYALNYADLQVVLRDVTPWVAGTWEYLIGADPDEIVSLPDLGAGESVDDHPELPQGARWLIGWWLNKGSIRPKKTPSSFMLNHPEGGPYWGPSIRDRIASQLEHIRHWEVACADYRTVPDVEATWFVDPPYQRAGRHYKGRGSHFLDFAELGAWCQGRQGQVIVCEADDADWLPFQPVGKIDGTEGRQKQSRARVEVAWLR
jgi:hypothetical protein